MENRPVPDDVLGQAYDAVLMRRLVMYLRPHWLAVGVAFVAILVGAASDLAQPWITALAIDKDIATGDLAGLTRLSFIFLGLLGAAFVAEFVQTSILQTTGQRIMHTMRMQVYGHLQQLDVSYYDRNPVGRMMTRVTTDVDALNDMFTSGVVTVFGDGLTLVGILVAMLWMSWRLALVAFLVLPLIVWTAHWFRVNARLSYRRVRGLVARLNAFLQEHLTGMSTVQLFGREARTLGRFDDINREHRDANLSSIFFYAVFYPLIELSAAISGALIIWVGGGWALHGTISIGVLVAFLQYSRRFFTPISDLSEKFNIMQAAMAASERIFSLLDTPIVIRSPGVAAPVPTRNGRIEFEHVWFAYNDEEFVLRDVSFVVESGARIGIVGATGSGKTTVINLLLRFYDVTRGRILVDGVDIREWDLSELRGLFGLVLQDVHLFSGTIEDNIVLGDARLTSEDARRAADVVHARRFIDARPGGFRAPVAERGATLSVGEKQLLSFARAIALDPRVLLLDEATSSIDTATEALIEDALHALMAGRTVVAIAHRLSTIQDMDRILVFSKGEMVEAGVHQELVARRGVYYRLYQLQYREGGVAAVVP